ncbi:carcinoembryonic antigen-related cell adhesion molecule 2-like [Astyanax mexicanus]|uniref:Carcinoembryonic antigen-related cell adhesion molecule 2-like n=1 Tax=Astyanax mexicanus TaxID=7994 RepID=A0A8T2KI84_ASTMX|nr:carcinoembryonic antigen-related cell adhesion molecule 2-like [Astyanax mexicanus]
MFSIACFSGVQSFSSLWGVNYTGAICAVRGSNVRIPCSYFYPSSLKVETVSWCSMNSNKGRCVDPPYVYNSSSNSTSEEFKYIGDKQSDCTLLISNAQFSHSAEYRFRFKTNVEFDQWTGDPGVTLRVEALQLTGPPENETLKEGDSVNLTCAVNCSLNSPQFVWFKNNQRLPSSDPVLHSSALTVEDSGSYSCALKTDEAARSEIILNKPLYHTLCFFTSLSTLNLILLYSTSICLDFTLFWSTSLYFALTLP